MPQIRSEIRHDLLTLFTEVGPAHHQAFIATDGADPEWPLWYAEFLQSRVNGLLGTELTRSALVYHLMNADCEMRATAPEADWREYDADYFLERFAPVTEETLALYYFPTCPFCRRVLAAIERLGIDVELRNIHAEREHFDALVGARGRGTVPVLRCTTAEVDRWLPESRDIIAYLESRFAQAAT